MKKNNLNVPAILIKNIKGKEKQLSGKLISINESKKTCNMVFNNGKLIRDIPMKHVLINEGFLDKVKEYGKKVVDFVKKTVKGFFVLVDEATGKFLTWSTLTVANTAKMAASGQLPTGIYFAPSSSMAVAAGVKGFSIDEAMAEAMNNDRVEIEKYWRRVIKRAGTTDETIEESVKYVNESYYKVNPAYKKLNEAAIYTLDDIKTEEGYGGYGTVVDAKQLKNRLIKSIRAQISGKPGKHADAPAPLVWGAPGIGKTAIINSTIKEMANQRGGINLSLLTIMLAGYTIENWTLPSIKSKGGEQKLIPKETERFTDCPKTWLPVYLKTSNPEEEKRRDHYCNTGEYRGEMYSSDGRLYEGGIVFMDEYSRTVTNVQNIIMGLINEHKFGDDYVVASKWGFVFAANRSYDDNQDDLDDLRYYPVAAQNNRFVQYTYVPKKEDWLEWATAIDPITHKANVPPFITEFIAQANDYVWYSTVQNGGYDDMLMKAFDGDKREVDSMKNNKMDKYGEMLNMDTLKMTKRLITPRTWANFIGPAFEQELITLLEGNSEGISGEEMYQKLIDKSVIKKTDKDGTKYNEYYGGILPNILIDALNDIDADYWEQEYEIMGGDEELDPAHTLNGKTGRYSKLMAWVRLQIAELSGDGEKASPLMKDYDDYNSYAKYMTDDVIDSIWQTGLVPEQYQKDDDYVPTNGIAGYNNTEFAKWKANSVYQKDVLLNKILPAYPGSIYDDMQTDVETLQNAKLPTGAECKVLFKELNEKTTFTITEDGKKPEKISLFFIEGDDIKDGETARAFCLMYRDSIVVRKLINILTWATKVAFQVKQINILSDLRSRLHDMIKDCPDFELYDKFLKLSELNAVRSQAGKNFANDPAYQKVLHSIPMSIIEHMFSVADGALLKYVKNRKKK